MKKSYLKATAGFVGALALVVLPVASASAVTEDTEINGTVGSTISITTDNTVNLAVTPTTVAKATSAGDTVTVNTNNSAGYNLTLEMDGAEQNLVSDTDSIVPTTGTFALPAALDTNSWGYRVDGAGTFGAGPTAAVTDGDLSSFAGTWAAVPAQGAANTLKTTSAVADNDTTEVYYAMSADTTQPTDTYTGTVQYTALAN